MTTTGAQLPTVSCILPTYNRGTLLCDTIDMLLAQSVLPVEIIVVDQSIHIPAEARSKLEEWAAAGSIEWLRQEEPNASMARNRGALTARGDVLLFLDDDIRIAEGFVEAHAVNYLDANVAAVAGQILEGDRELVDELPQMPGNPELNWLYFPRNFGNRCRTTWMASGNFSIRRPIYFEVGGMDENYFKGAYREESDFAIRFIRRGYRFQFDPTASIYHLAMTGAPFGGTRQSSWVKSWFNMFGFWYFAFGCATSTTWPVHLKGAIRYFLVNSNTIRRPWQIPLLLAQFAFTLPMAVACRMRGSRTLANVAIQRKKPGLGKFHQAEAICKAVHDD
jgi:glycosyltransferase involved in cell wall biosynthesis